MSEKSGASKSTIKEPDGPFRPIPDDPCSPKHREVAAKVRCRPSWHAHRSAALSVSVCLSNVMVWVGNKADDSHS